MQRFVAQDIPNISDFIGAENKLLSILVIILIFSVIDFVLSRLINRFFKILYQSTNSISTLDSENYLVNIRLFSRITIFLVRLVMITFAVMIALSVFGIGVASFLASAGFVGILITIALGDIIRDLIAGFVLLKDKYFVIGDIVILENFEGTVTQINTRSTVIVNENNDQMVIYNRLIAKVIKKGDK